MTKFNKSTIIYISKQLDKGKGLFFRQKGYGQGDYPVLGVRRYGGVDQVFIATRRIEGVLVPQEWVDIKKGIVF